MPLYECERCHCVENTALTNFWESLAEGKPRLCSECDPEIGRWHGSFPKISMTEYAAKYPNARKVEYPVAECKEALGNGQR